MAHTKSALKRARQNIRRRSANRAGKSIIKTASEKLAAAIAGKDATAVSGALKALHSVLDKCAKRGVVPRNTAIRLKARANARVRAGAK